MFDRSLLSKLRALPWRHETPFAVFGWLYLAVSIGFVWLVA